MWAWQLQNGSWVGLCCWSRVLAACVLRWFRHNKLTFFGHFSALRSVFRSENWGAVCHLSPLLYFFPLLAWWFLPFLQAPWARSLRRYWPKRWIPADTTSVKFIFQVELVLKELHITKCVMGKIISLHHLICFGFETHNMSAPFFIESGQSKFSGFPHKTTKKQKENDRKKQ